MLSAPEDAGARPLTPQQSLEAITAHYKTVFCTPPPNPVFPAALYVQEPLNVTPVEISAAIGSLSSRKALPADQAPAVLWKVCHESIVTILRRDFARLFQTGKVWMPVAPCSHCPTA